MLEVIPSPTDNAAQEANPPEPLESVLRIGKQTLFAWPQSGLFTVADPVADLPTPATPPTFHHTADEAGQAFLRKAESEEPEKLEFLLRAVAQYSRDWLRREADANLQQAMQSDPTLEVPQHLLTIGEFSLYWFPTIGKAAVGNHCKGTPPLGYDSLHAGIMALLYAAHVDSPDLFNSLWNGMNGYGKICYAAAVQTELLQSAVLDVRQ